MAAASYYPRILGAINSTKPSGNFGPKLNGSVRSNRKSFEKTGPPFEVVLFSRSDRLEFWLNGSRPLIPKYGQTDNVKPLTANRGLPFAERWPNLDLKASNEKKLGAT